MVALPVMGSINRSAPCRFNRSGRLRSSHRARRRTRYRGAVSATLSQRAEIEGRYTMHRAIPAPGLSGPAAWAMAALWLATAGLARAETADERDLRDHAVGKNLPAVQTLLASGTNPNVPDHDGRTAVHHAALGRGVGLPE